MQTPLPQVESEHLKLETSPEEPRQFLQTMYELIWLAFRTDTTRVATWQIGRENGVGISDYLARAVGFNLTHQLTHNTKEPGGWQNFGIYCAFLMEEYGRFLERLRTTEEPGGQGNMLDNTVCLFGSASSAFHLSRNYPLVLAGGRGMGFEHGRYLNFGPAKPEGGAWEGGREPWQKEVTHEDRPLAHLFVSMLQRLGVQTETFAEITGRVVETGPGVDESMNGRRVFVPVGAGGFADEVVAMANRVLPIPDALSDGQGATFMQSYLTAWFAFTRRTQVEPGKTMLVLGAGGGVGLAAVDVGVEIGRAHV